MNLVNLFAPIKWTGSVPFRIADFIKNGSLNKLFNNIMNNLGIEYWLSGVYRDGTILPWDDDLNSKSFLMNLFELTNSRKNRYRHCTKRRKMCSGPYKTC